MKRRHLIQPFLVLALTAGAWACQHQDPLPTGSVTLTLSAGSFETRSVTPGTTGAADGGAIVVTNGDPDLVIAIANASGSIVAWYPDKNGTEEPNSSCFSTHSGTSSTQSTIRFAGLAAGTYSVWAVANTDGLWGNMRATLLSCTTSAQLQALCFTELTGTATPTISQDRMPLSATGTLTVNANKNGQVNLELLRCLSKVDFSFKNETSESLTLTSCSVTLQRMNPASAYLFAVNPDFTAAEGRNLTLSSAENLVLASGATASLSPALVFPSVAPAQTLGNRYLCDVSFSIGETSYSFTDMPVHDYRSADILALERNQYLQITTRINNGNQVSFNFQVLDWEPKTEEVFFH